MSTRTMSWNWSVIGCAAAAAAAALAAPAFADDAKAVAMPESWREALQWRSIGPANMGGRITALAVNEADPCTWWAATASGGLLKTTNDGITFEHQFDREATVSIGDVAVAASDPDIVWVGTGEANPRNSVSWGDGVYKSTDGGKTWKNMGLKKTFQIGRIAIHPEDPNTVYVGAMGRLWGPNEERGLFKTTDGGESWEKVLYVDEKTGVIDMRMHPEDPDTLIVATWERGRDGFDGNDPAPKWGPGSGVYRTTNGGETFAQLTYGLPECELGRIGLDYYRADPDIVFAIIESERIGEEPENAAYAGIRGEDADVGARITEVTEGGPAAEAELKVGDIVLRVEETTVHSYNDFLKQVRSRLAGDTIEIEVSRERKSVTLEMTFSKRPGQEEDEEEEQEGQQRRRQQQRDQRPFGAMLGGQRENMQDQQGPDGRDFGGVYRSDDGGDTWKRINSVNPRPMYFSQIRVDPSDSNHLFVLGVSLYRSKDGGETFTDDGGGRGVHVDHHALWIDPHDGRHQILGNDGGMYVTHDRMENWDHLNHVAIGQFYHVTVDPKDNYRVYGGLQDNGSWGGPSRTRDGGGPINADWFRVGGGDGFICLVDREDPDQVYFESQNGSIGRINLRTGDRGFMRPRAPRGTRYRFNWKTPFILSNHNSRIYYAAGNHVFRSLDRGTGLKAISPEITNTDRGSGTALAESPVNADVMYAGTDDGALWATRNGGHEWINLFEVTEEDAAAAEEEDAASAPAEPDRPRGGARGEGGPGGPGGGPRGAARGEGGPGGGAGPGGRGGRGNFLERLRGMDENGDGKIQKSEVPERAQRMLERLDTNGDDVIDEKEMAAIPERMGRGGPGGGERGQGRRPRGGGQETPEPAPEEEPPAAPAEAAPAAEAARPATEPEPEPEKEQPAAEEKTPPATEEQPSAAAAEPAAASPEDDPISGEWSGQAINENMPPDQGGFTLKLELAADGTVTGTLTSEMNDGEIDPGKFDREKGTLVFDFQGEQMTLTFRGRIEGSRLTGDIEIGGGAFSLEFEATRKTTAVAATDAQEEPEDDGYEWAPISELLPTPMWISSLEASRFAEGRVYVTVDGHRSDDDAPYVFVSENHGTTWRSLLGDLPATAGSVRVLGEDLTRAEILYLGTEFGAWVSLDRGASWTSLKTNLPTVAVHEIAQHPTSGEIIAGTHGRSVWILDVTPLRQATGETLAKSINLFKPKDPNYWRSEPSRGRELRGFAGRNPSDGLQIFYAVKSDLRDVSLRITDLAGRSVRELEASGSAGLNRVTWDLRRAPRRAGQGQRQQFQRGRRRSGPRVEPGAYQVVLAVGETEYKEQFVVRGDPEYPGAVLWGEAYDEMLDQMRQFEEDEEENGEDGDQTAPSD